METVESVLRSEVKQLYSDFRLDAAKTCANRCLQSICLQAEIQEKFIKINGMKKMVYSYRPNTSIDPYNPNPVYHVFVTESSIHNTASRRLLQILGGYSLHQFGSGQTGSIAAYLLGGRGRWTGSS